MKYLIVLTLFISNFVNSQNLKNIRLQYPEAAKSIEITTNLELELENVDSSSSSLLLAYKGAILTLQAKFSKSKSDKKKYFKEGVSLIENAIQADDSNIEIRYLRLSVQENSPKFLGYHKNIEEDKEFILKNYRNITSQELKSVVTDYVLHSKNFDEKEQSILIKP